MTIRSERRFLVTDQDWSSFAPAVTIRLGYLPTRDDVAASVRMAGDEGLLTVTGPDRGAGRPEFEFPISSSQALQMLVDLCDKPIVEKTRHSVVHRDRIWEVDVFHSDNEGLVVAATATASMTENIDLPPWVRSEVTDDPRYGDASLARIPYRNWSGTQST